MVIISFARNEQKKAKRARHEREKGYMQVLQDLGNTVGEYVGDGQGENESPLQALDPFIDDEAGIGVDSGFGDVSMEQNEDSSDDA